MKKKYPNSQQASNSQQTILPALHSEIFCTAWLKLKNKNETKWKKPASTQQAVLIKGWSITPPASGQVPRKSLPLGQDCGPLTLQGRGSWFIVGLPHHWPREPQAWSGLGHFPCSLAQIGVLLLLLLSHFSRVWLCATPWTAAHQAPPSMGSSRQEYWSGVPLPSLNRSAR